MHKLFDFAGIARNVMKYGLLAPEIVLSRVEKTHLPRPFGTGAESFPHPIRREDWVECHYPDTMPDMSLFRTPFERYSAEDRQFLDDLSI